MALRSAQAKLLVSIFVPILVDATKIGTGLTITIRPAAAPTVGIYSGGHEDRALLPGTLAPAGAWRDAGTKRVG